MKKKSDDPNDYQKNIKSLWKVHENLTFCLESLGLWGAAQVSYCSIHLVILSLWLNLSFFYYCGSLIWLFEAYIHISAVPIYSSGIFCLYNSLSCLLVGFFWVFLIVIRTLLLWEFVFVQFIIFNEYWNMVHFK